MSGSRRLTDVCRHCEETEEDHHAFAPFLVPVSCVCPPGDWRNPDRIPDVCAASIPVDSDSRTCLKCEHEAICHSVAK